MSGEDALRLLSSNPLAKAISALTEFLALLYNAKEADAARIVENVLAVIIKSRQFNEHDLPRLLREAAHEEFSDDPGRSEEALDKLMSWVSELAF